MTDPKHAATPWRYQAEDEHGFGHIKTRRTFEVYSFSGQHGHPATCLDEADAQIICRAVNSHAALVAACEAAEKALGRVGACTEFGLAEQLDAALKLAKEGAE